MRAATPARALRLWVEQGQAILLHAPLSQWDEVSPTLLAHVAVMLSAALTMNAGACRFWSECCSRANLQKMAVSHFGDGGCGCCIVVQPEAAIGLG